MSAHSLKFIFSWSHRPWLAASARPFGYQSCFTPYSFFSVLTQTQNSASFPWFPPKAWFHTKLLGTAHITDGTGRWGRGQFVTASQTSKWPPQRELGYSFHSRLESSDTTPDHSVTLWCFCISSPPVLNFPSAPKFLFISPKNSLCHLFSWNSSCQGPISTTQWLINKESFLSRRKFYCSSTR